MIFFALILGILSTILTVIISVLVVSSTGIFVNSFSMFFILPIGGIVTGILCSAGFYWFFSITGKKVGSFDKVVGLLLSICGFVSIYYGLYFSTYVVTSPNGSLEINHKFKGEHISNFSYETTGQPVNFLSYLKEEINNRESTFFISVGKVGKKVPIPVTAGGLCVFHE